MLKSAIPLLHVSDSERAEDFYCRRLGFRRTFTYRIDHKKPDPGLAQITIQLDLGRRSLTVPPPSRPPCRSRCEARQLGAGA